MKALLAVLTLVTIGILAVLIVQTPSVRHSLFGYSYARCTSS